MDRASHVAIDFARQVSVLLNLAISKNPRDKNLKDLRTRYSIIQVEDPIRIIEEGGPRVWRYREQISAGDIRHFLSADLVAEDNAVGDEDKLNYARQLIETFRLLWHLLTPDEKAVVINGFRRLVARYAEYVQQQRQV